MRSTRRNRFAWLSVAALAALAVCHAASAPSIVDMASHEVTAYLGKLADIHCTEVVTQQKLAPNGHVEASLHAQYDYLLMMSGNATELRLNESRVESPSDHHKILQTPMLVSNGISTLLLVFHPYYRDSFHFEIGAAQMLAGKPTIPVRFTPIDGRRMPAALALRGREYPLELQGTAWLDERTGAPVRIDAALLHDMSDVGLRSLHIDVQYQPTQLVPGQPRVALPAVASVDVTTPRQHWRNTHRFADYKSFSTAAEQSSDVKVHTEKKQNSEMKSEQKEKP